MSDPNRPTKKFLCRYFHDGSWWGCDIDAYDFADAEARCKKIGGLQLDGELVATIPAGPGAGLLARCICGVMNWLRPRA